MVDLSGLRTDPLEFCSEILPHVSRTFALTIPALREPLRTHVKVSYLLCRVVDTIEDHTEISDDLRQDLFTRFANLIQADPESSGVEEFTHRWPGHVDIHHNALVSNVGLVLGAYRTFPEPTRDPIRRCVLEMIDGMRSFPTPLTSREPAEACKDLDQLEHYCHYVAGTVGVLLSHLFAAELGINWMTSDRIEQGRRFGLGLQLTNIIKDHASDRNRGISFIPLAWFENDRLSKRGGNIIVTRALEHFDAAMTYVHSIPPDREDMRLFCLWASHLALATLRLAANGDSRPAKVNREELWDIIEKAKQSVRSNEELATLHGDYKRAALAALSS